MSMARPLAAVFAAVMVALTLTLTVGLPRPALGAAAGSDSNSNSHSSAADLPVKVRGLFETYCHRCHGKDLSDEGGMGYVTDLAKLVENKKVVPGAPGRSPLFGRLTEKRASKHMPPQLDPDDEKTPLAQPTAAEIALVEAWINAGAPDAAPAATAEKPKPREFLSDFRVLELIFDDLQSPEVDLRQRKFLRYFTIAHLDNAGLTEDDLAIYRHGLSKLINSLSWGEKVVPPTPIDPARTILRIDLRDYEWDAETWRALLRHNPYGIVQAHASVRGVYEMTECTLPVLRADWFVYAASKPPLYHWVLGIPETDRDLEWSRLHLDVARNIRDERVRRAGFHDSGVSKSHNRMIERHASPLTKGAYWKSYDFGSDVGAHNLFARPLGPGEGDYAFRQNGGEIIFSLPNGLQGYMLVDAQGKRLDTAPSEIVQDPDQADGRVVNGISCMDCHRDGIKEKDDQIRATAANPVAFPREVAATILALYPPASSLRPLQQSDAARFLQAVAEAGVPDTLSFDPIFRLAHRFEEELDLRLAAAESGLKPEVFRRILERAPALARELGPLLVAGGKVKRETFVSVFPLIIHDAGLGQHLAFTPLPAPAPAPSFTPPPRARASAASPVPPSPVPPSPVRVPASPDIEGQSIVTRLAGIKLRLIPAGEVVMGSLWDDDWDADDDESPRHRVRITRPFYLGATEVTQGQYRAMTGQRPSHFQGSDDLPVEQVSWLDAISGCNALSRAEGLPLFYRVEGSNVSVPDGKGPGYRLPTEAEWEYACRAKNPARYSFGDDRARLARYAWFSVNSGRQTHPAGQMLSNAFGLSDMHGNVWEWCSDGYQRNFYAQSQSPSQASLPVDDPVCRFEGGALRVIRGGSWYDFAPNCRSADRNGCAPGDRLNNLGFRVARVASRR